MNISLLDIAKPPRGKFHHFVSYKMFSGSFLRLNMASEHTDKRSLKYFVCNSGILDVSAYGGFSSTVIQNNIKI